MVGVWWEGGGKVLGGLWAGGRRLVGGWCEVIVRIVEGCWEDCGTVVGGSRRNVRLLLRRCRGQGPHLAIRGTT